MPRAFPEHRIDIQFFVDVGEAVVGHNVTNFFAELGDDFFDVQRGMQQSGDLQYLVVFLRKLANLGGIDNGCQIAAAIHRQHFILGCLWHG